MRFELIRCCYRHDPTMPTMFSPISCICAIEYREWCLHIKCVYYCVTWANFVYICKINAKSRTRMLSAFSHQTHNVQKSRHTLSLSFPLTILLVAREISKSLLFPRYIIYKWNETSEHSTQTYTQRKNAANFLFTFLSNVWNAGAFKRVAKQMKTKT